MRIYFEVAVPELAGSFDATQREGGWEYHVRWFPDGHSTGLITADTIDPFDVIRLVLTDVHHARKATTA